MAPPAPAPNPPPVGMTNVGNTCYLNTFLQCMAAVPALEAHLRTEKNPKRPVAHATAKLMTLLDLASPNACLEPRVVRTFLNQLSQYTPSYLSLTSGEQHDLCELYVWWMDKIHEEQAGGASAKTKATPASSSASSPSSPAIVFATSPTWEPFHQMCLEKWNGFHANRIPSQMTWAMLYEGLLIQQVQCPKCRRCFHNPEPVSCLTLDIPAPASAGTPVSLADCFRHYFKPETLSEWRCDDCKIDTAAEKLVRFWKAPPVLTIVLKRFETSPDGRMWKNKTPVQIPMAFHFLPDTELHPDIVQAPPADYRLVAVANHYGGIQGGHYTATVRRGDAWWRLDDDHVSPQCDHWNDQNPVAYVLFYER